MLYVRSTLQWTVWNYDADDRTYELEWVRVGDTYTSAPSAIPCALSTQPTRCCITRVRRSMCR